MSPSNWCNTTLRMDKCYLVNIWSSFGQSRRTRQRDRGYLNEIGQEGTWNAHKEKLQQSETQKIKKKQQQNCNTAKILVSRLRSYRRCGNYCIALTKNNQLSILTFFFAFALRSTWAIKTVNEPMKRRSCSSVTFLINVNSDSSYPSYIIKIRAFISIFFLMFFVWILSCLLPFSTLARANLRPHRLQWAIG